MLTRRGAARSSTTGLAQAEYAIRSDVNTLLSAIRTDLAKLDGKIDKLAIQMKPFIILALVAIAMFSPNLAALLKIAK